MQTIKVQPWHYYHVSVMAKTEDCTSGDFRISRRRRCQKGYPLNWQPPAIHKTMDWTRLHATFASLDNREVGLYLGSYNAKGGKIWWSDVRIEPGGLVNVIRRPSLPLTITSEDGKTVYVEGKDFSEVKDPKLGNDPNPGYFTYWHEPPAVTVPEGSRLKQGERVLASYHFATLAGKSHQINCCLSEPKIYDLLARQVQWVKETAQPDFYMMAHDEIRHCGWDDSCTRRNMTCGQILAENVSKCSPRSSSKTDPGKPIVAWNDMFDPFHNARKEGGCTWPRATARGTAPGRACPARHGGQLAPEQRREPEVLRRPRQPADPGGLLRCRPAPDHGVAGNGRQGQGRLRRDVHHLGPRLLEARRVHADRRRVPCCPGAPGVGGEMVDNGEVLILFPREQPSVIARLLPGDSMGVVGHADVRR